jgi:hypothetical protein
MNHRISQLVLLSLIGAFPMSVQLAAQTLTAPLTFVTAQPPNESLSRVFLGAIVTNQAGETVGDVSDIIFNHSGQITVVVLGVGGFLGIGEKYVAVPFNALGISANVDGHRSIVIPATKDMLMLAPGFTATEKTTMDAVKDRAVDLAHKTADKANALKDQAAKKIDEMTKGNAVKK